MGRKTLPGTGKTKLNIVDLRDVYFSQISQERHIYCGIIIIPDLQTVLRNIRNGVNYLVSRLLIRHFSPCLKTVIDYVKLLSNVVILILLGNDRGTYES